ncbi:MAG: polyprenyl synthetase family protein [Bosea sp. (in: a-proteobacteria)]
MIMTDSAFHESLASTAAAVEARLAALLGSAVQTGEIARPERLMAAMRHGALDGGKRLRPFLSVAAAEACGASQSALDTGCAIELIHCYSLIHDDLPAMDNDALRRGRPTVHVAFGEATAILAGDALLTLGFELMAAPSTHPDAATRANLVLLLAQGAGLGGMVGGQMLDLAAEGRFGDGKPLPLDAASIRQLQAMKTGALLKAAVLAGGLVAGAEKTKMAALATYGGHLGAAFQIADDILDVEASPEQLGKATAKDAALGKGTLVTLLGLDAARQERDRLAEAAIAALAGLGPRADLLRSAARFAAERKS